MGGLPGDGQSPRQDQVRQERDAGGSRFRSLTMLISDIVGSTDMRVRLGADGERLLRLHENLARDAIAANQGHFVKGLGDGAMAVFDAAADAVACAVRLQRLVEALHRRGEATDLHIRIGVSSGDVSVGPDDCYGLPVAEAVRLCAAAGTGEILIADVVRALARQVDVPLTSVGELSLKGLGAPVTAWRVEWEQRTDDWAAIPLPGRLVATGGTRFVGRARELATMVPACAQALTGDRRRLVLLAGDPGTGKSALAAELARRLQAEAGALVLHGGCDEELRPPYQPFAQALRHLVRYAPTTVLDDYVRRHGGDLNVLVPELAERLGRLPSPRWTAEVSDRYLLFTAVTGLLETVLEQHPVVLVLDDLQWADRGTLLMLRHLLVASELTNIVVIATFRDSDIDPATDLPDLLAELHRIEGVHRMDVAGLAADELYELVCDMLSGSTRDPFSVARAVNLETEGNPFFAIELVRHLDESDFDDANVLLAQLPPSVREVVRRRVRRLGEEVMHVLSVAAVIGAEFSLAAVADLAAMPTDRALDLLERATDAAVLREVPNSSRFRFVHALVQHTLYDELSSARRRRLHRAAAEAMERLSAPPALAAAHWAFAEDMGDPLRTLAACTAAADAALAQRAPDEAAHWYNEAFIRTDDVDDEVRCELLLRLGEARRLAGDPEHRRTLSDAAAMARRLGDAERMAKAALAKSRWFSSTVSSSGDTDQVELLEASLAAIGPEPSPLRARLLATLASELVYHPRADERFVTADEALAVARAVGDPMTLFDVLFRRAPVARRSSRAEIEAELTEMQALVADGQDPLRQALADVITVHRRIEAGDIDGCDPPLRRAVSIAEELRLPVLRWLVTVLQGTVATVRGELVDAEKLVLEARELSQSTDQPDASTWFGVQLYMIRFEQGRLEELAPLFEAAIARGPRLHNWHAALAMAQAELGRVDEARVVVSQLMAIDYPALRTDPHWLLGMCCLGSAAAKIDQPDVARVIYDALRPHAGEWPSIMAMTLGSVDRILGELAHSIGEDELAEQHFRAAIASNDLAPAPGFAARARIGLMDVLRSRPEATAGAEFAALDAQVRADIDGRGLHRAEKLLADVEAAAPWATAYPAVPDQPQVSGLLHVDET
jgi:class 3 adenylate cyclase/tetratricopeptide (TPR) repeat protein